MVSAARRLTSWHKDAGSRVRFNSASVTTPNLFKRLSCARYFFWKVSMMDLDLLLLNIMWFSRRDGTSAGVAISCATENREQKFYIITQKKYMHVWLHTSPIILLRLWSKRPWLAHTWGIIFIFFTDGAWTWQSRLAVHLRTLLNTNKVFSYHFWSWLNLDNNLIFLKRKVPHDRKFIYKNFKFLNIL